MAAGDAQRVWHPEMLAELKQHWRPGMAWDEVIAFCDRMTIMRKELAVANDIKPPMIKCHKCGALVRVLPIRRFQSDPLSTPCRRSTASPRRN